MGEAEGAAPTGRRELVMLLRPSVLDGHERDEGWVFVTDDAEAVELAEVGRAISLGAVMDLRAGEWRDGALTDEASLFSPILGRSAPMRPSDWFGGNWLTGWRHDPVVWGLTRDDLGRSLFAGEDWQGMRLPRVFSPARFTRSQARNPFFRQAQADAKGLSAVVSGFFNQLWMPFRGLLSIDSYMREAPASQLVDDAMAATLPAWSASIGADATRRWIVLHRQIARRRDALVASLFDKLRSGEWHAVGVAASDVELRRAPIAAGWWDKPAMSLDWEADELRPVGPGADRLPYFHEIEFVPHAVGDSPEVPAGSSLRSDAKELTPAEAKAALVDKIATYVVKEHHTRKAANKERWHKERWAKHCGSWEEKKQGQNKPIIHKAEVGDWGITVSYFKNEVWPECVRREEELGQRGRPSTKPRQTNARPAGTKSSG